MLGSTGDYLVGARYATIGSLLSAVAVLALQIEDDKVEQTNSDFEKKKKNKESWKSRASVVCRLAGLFLIVKVMTGTASSMSRSVQPIILKNDLGFDEAKMGSIMSA